MDRKETTRRFKELQNQIARKKHHVVPHLQAQFDRSFSSVKFASDGLIDESTVDGLIRASLLAVLAMEHRRDAKQAASLRDIQSAYYELLSDFLRRPYEHMQLAQSDPESYAGWFTSDDTRVTKYSPVFDELVSRVIDFWGSTSESAWAHLEDTQVSKGVFGGEIFPDGAPTIVSSTGIYFDTTVLPDPILKTARVLRDRSPAKRVEEVLRIGLQVMQYRDLATADTPTPLIVILPDRHSLEESYQTFIAQSAIQDVTRHACGLFGQDFTNFAELKQFVGRFRSAEQILALLKTPSELVYDVDSKEDLATQIETSVMEYRSSGLDLSHGDALLLQMVSRFSQANDVFQRSQDLRGTPIIQAPTSWLWFNWMLRSSANSYDLNERTHLHVARAFEGTLKTEFSWLGNVPPAALLEIRKAGAMDEIRAILSTGIRELVEIRPDNFHRTGDKVFDNLSAAFQAHERKLDALRLKKWRFAGLEIGSFIVVGGIEMAAALTGRTLFGATAAAASMLGVFPSLKDLKASVDGIRAESRSLANTGVGILFKRR